MARRKAQKIEPGLFEKTEPTTTDGKPSSILDLTTKELGRVLPTGISLRETEMQTLDAMKEKHQVSRSFLMRFMVRLGIAAYQDGTLPEIPHRLP